MPPTTKTPHLTCTTVPSLNLYHAVYLASATDEKVATGNDNKGGKHIRTVHARVRPYVGYLDESPWKERITTPAWV